VPISSIRARAATWVANADPSGLLYGAIVSAAVLVTVSAHASGTDYVVISTAGFLVVYWMAHVYINTLSTQFEGDRHSFFARLAHAAWTESSVLRGGIPAIVVYSLVAALGADVSAAAFVAAYFSVVLLMVIGYLGAHQAGLRGWPLAGEVAAAACFGVVIVIGKSLLH
jgi:hypothetical protein